MRNTSCSVPFVRDPAITRHPSGRLSTRDAHHVNDHAQQIVTPGQELGRERGAPSAGLGGGPRPRLKHAALDCTVHAYAQMFVLVEREEVTETPCVHEPSDSRRRRRHRRSRPAGAGSAGMRRPPGERPAPPNHDYLAAWKPTLESAPGRDSGYAAGCHRPAAPRRGAICSEVGSCSCSS